MTKEEPLNIVSYGRGTPGRGRPLSMGQIKLISRTVGRTPEVMVKVVNNGSSSSGAVRGHVGYIGRKGKVDLEIDNGEILHGKHVGEIASVLAINPYKLRTEKEFGDYAKKVTAILQPHNSPPRK